MTLIPAISETRERYPVITQHVEDVARITLYVSDIFRLWSGVATNGATPMPVVTIDQALMSAAYVVAVMLVLPGDDWLGVRGRRLPYTDELLHDQRVQRLIAITHLVVDRAYTDPVRIEIDMRSGETFSAEAPQFRRGHMHNPMTPGEITQKFRNLTSYCIEETVASRIIDQIRDLDRVTDVTEVAAELRQNGGCPSDC